MIRSFRSLWWKVAEREPATVTFAARSPTRSNDRDFVAVVALPRITAVPLRRFVLTR